MDYSKFCDWLISDKRLSQRAAKDVVSRCKRISRMLNMDELGNDALELLCTDESFKESSMFIKSQLKRAIVLLHEFKEDK